MTTLLKRNSCNIDGSIREEDVATDYTISVDSTIQMTLDVVEHGVMDAIAWVEEHHTTWLPWIMSLLFFWCITPKVFKVIYIHAQQDEKTLDFEFKMNDNMSVHDNIYNVPKEFGINKVWFHLD